MTASVCFAARGSPSADLLLSMQNVSCGLLEWCDQHEAEGNPQCIVGSTLACALA